MSVVMTRHAFDKHKPSNAKKLKQMHRVIIKRTVTIADGAVYRKFIRDTCSGLIVIDDKHLPEVMYTSHFNGKDYYTTEKIVKVSYRHLLFTEEQDVVLFKLTYGDFIHSIVMAK